MSIHLLLSAGRGPQECTWALARLLPRLEADATRRHLEFGRLRKLTEATITVGVAVDHGGTARRHSDMPGPVAVGRSGTVLA